MTISITRRAFTTAVAASTAFPALADTAALEAEARKEGTLTWYIAQVDSETAEQMGRAFTAQFPGIKVSVIRTTGQVAYERLSQDLKNNAPQCDVFSTTDMAHMPALIKRNALAHYVPENAAFMAPAFQGLGDPGYDYPSTSTLMLMIYNSQKVKPEEAPKTWTDLLDPKWKGKISWGMSSSTGGVSFIAGIMLSMGDEKGLAYLKRLAQQNIQNVDVTARAMVDRVGAGDYPLTLGIFNHHTVMNAQKGAPVTWLKFEPIVAPLALIGITKDAPHPNAARLFVEFITSEEGQKLFADLDFLPAMPSVLPKTPSLTPAGGNFKPIYLTQELVAANQEKWNRIMKELFQ
jgi:iron(III) transport system substrate-binding protein